MRTIPLIALVLAFATSLRAADALELARLRAAYDVAVGNAARPVIQEHIASLGKLRDGYLRSSKIDAANKVQGEIDRSTATMTKGYPTPPAADPSAGAMPELDKLRTAHATAMERTLKPLWDTYVRELEKMRDFYARSGNLDGANAAQTELTTLKPGAAGTATHAAKPTVVSQVGDEKFFVNKTWLSQGTASYHFGKDGNGLRTFGALKSEFTWKKLETGIVEIVYRETKDGQEIRAYFRFDNRETGAKGEKPDIQPYPTRIKK